MAQAPPQLAPAPAQIGIFDQLIARQSETLMLKEKMLSLSGDSFDITLISGQPIMRVQGKTLSISGRKSIFDMAGNHLFDVCKEHMHIHSTYVALDPRGTKIMEVKSSFKLIGSKATATFISPSSGKSETLVMKGNWFDTTANIVDETHGTIVATISRNAFKARDIFFNKQTYAVTIAPGVDMALMAALCICMDEKNNEGGGAFSGGGG